MLVVVIGILSKKNLDETWEIGWSKTIMRGKVMIEELLLGMVETKMQVGGMTNLSSGRKMMVIMIIVLIKMVNLLQEIITMKLHHIEILIVVQWWTKEKEKTGKTTFRKTNQIRILTIIWDVKLLTHTVELSKEISSQIPSLLLRTEKIIIVGINLISFVKSVIVVWACIP